MSKAVNSASEAHGLVKICPNCDATVIGNFCANCGQEAHLHHASTREFLHEFIGHYVALEGKLWGTLVRLLFRPGALTNEYIRGRRVRFVQPLRIYLTLSVIFFVLLKLTGGFDPVMEEEAKKVNAKAAVTRSADATPAPAAPTPVEDADEKARSAAAAEAAIAEMEKDLPTLDPEAARRPKPARSDDLEQQDIDTLLNDWPTLRQKWHAFESLSHEDQKKVFKDGFYRYAPYAIFCLMPVFALILKVLYLGSGRRFGEHMLFALHSNAFAYFIFSLMLLHSFKGVNFVLWLWLLGYLPWAMRRVYHSSRFGTIWRWLTLMLFFSLAILIAVLFSAGMGLMSVH